MTGLLVGIVGGVLFIWVPYLLLKKTPRRWWLYTGLAAIPFTRCQAAVVVVVSRQGPNLV